MKLFLRILVLQILFCSSFGAQEREWKSLSNNYHQRVIFENSKETLQNADSLILAVYRFEKNQTIDLSDLTKLQLVPIKTSFKDLKQQLKIADFNPELKKKSEYHIKFEAPNVKTYRYNIYLLDNADKNQIESLHQYLSKSFILEKIEFISKEQAMKEASETLGINASDLFEGNVFPASFEIQSKKRINTKSISAKFPDLVEEIRNNDSDFGIIIMKVST